MEDGDSLQMGFVQRRLPWIIAVAFFGLYFFTMSDWVTGTSIFHVAKVKSWDWLPQTNNPLLYLVTSLVKLLPNASQTWALNLVAAIFGALTLGQLARSVSLLPHDRTRDQRHREHSDYSLLTISTAWLPPLFACLICGLQLTFWEEATALTGDILTLFIFSVLVRCLLEFRLSEQDKWLYLLAFIYGFAIPSDWSFIGFAPLFFGAIVWMKGATILNARFVAIMTGLGSIGLFTYIILPLATMAQNPALGSFVVLLKHQIGHQLQFVFGIPKTIVLLLSLTSVVPVVIMGIRFPSSIGDVSVVGAMLSNFMIRLMHVLFLVACVWVAFDPAFSPRKVAGELRFVTFYYLGALAAGYFSGYVLLVFGKPPTQRRGRRGSGSGGMIITAALCIAMLAVPIGLFARNLPSIQITNGDQLKKFSDLLVKNLPDEKAFIISDDSFSALLVRAALDRQGLERDYTIVEMSALGIFSYEREFRRELSAAYPEVFAEENLPLQITLVALLSVLGQAAEVGPVYYLNSSFGLYFEVFYAAQRGLVSQLIPYEENQMEPPVLLEGEIIDNQTFWDELAEQLPDLGTKGRYEDDVATRIIEPWVSREQNVWAVTLQKMNRLEDAKEGLERSLRWNSRNTCAEVNLRQNEVLQGNDPRGGVGLSPAETQAVQRNYGSFEQLMSANGPIDEAGFRLQLADEFAAGGNSRQAMLNYKRAVELDPSNPEASLRLANSFMLAGFPQELLAQLERTKAEHAEFDTTVRSEMARLEALGYYAIGNKAGNTGNEVEKKTAFDKAEQILKGAVDGDPENEALLETLYQVYLFTGRTAESLEYLDRHLKLNPTDTRLLQNKALAHIRLKEYDKAVEPLNTVLQGDSENAYARLNRAISYFRSNNHEKAKEDYTILADADSKHRAVYYGLGRIAESDGDSETALKHFERYLELAPKDTDEYREIEQAVAGLKGE